VASTICLERRACVGLWKNKISSYHVCYHGACESTAYYITLVYYISTRAQDALATFHTFVYLCHAARKSTNKKGGKMKLHLTLFAGLGICLLSGCAWQSQALKLSEDTYQVSANASPARGGVTGAREMALTNANEKCDSLKKKIEVMDIKTEFAWPANGVATVTFACK
jgi:hypothetical protein